MYKSITSVLLIFCLLSFSWAQEEMPEKPDSWVNDYAGILSPAEQQSLNGMLSGLEKRSSNQIFIALFNRMPDNTYLEDFTVKLYEKWRPGLAEQDNGILIVVFAQDRKMRIEVGYGLEDIVTDAQAGMIIRNYIAPSFQQGKYYQGLDAALKVLIPAVEGKYQLPRPDKKGKSGRGFSINFLIIGFFLLMIITRFFRGPRSTGYGTKGRGVPPPFFLGGFGGGRSGGGFSSGGGFGGGFGGMSGGGGASGSW